MGSALLSAPGSVTAADGGSVTVPCQYDQQFRENTKYWCKGIIYEFCSIVVKTPRTRENNRSSIRDDKEAGVFTVTMTSLRKSDQDTYWCVVARYGRNVYTKVTLRVSPAGQLWNLSSTLLQQLLDIPALICTVLLLTQKDKSEMTLTCCPNLTNWPHVMAKSRCTVYKYNSWSVNLICWCKVFCSAVITTAINTPTSSSPTQDEIRWGYTVVSISPLTWTTEITELWTNFLHWWAKMFHLSAPNNAI